MLVETQAAILTVPVVRYEARAPSIAPVGTLDRFQDAGGVAGAVLRQVQDATRGIVPLSRTCYRARVRGFARLHLIPVCFGIVRRQQDAEAAAPRFAFEGLKERDHRAAVVCLAAHRLRAGVDHHQAGALRRLDAWRGTAPVDDASLAVYLGTIFEAGRAPATAALAVAAVRFRAKLAGQADPAGEATARVLAGYRRTAADRGRGQAAPLSADGLAAILATAERPRTDGRGVESHTTAQRRGRTDAVIAGLLFMGGLRRSEVSALEWRDVADASDGDGVLITVRTSKTNQEGDTADVRYLKNGAAAAVRTLRTDRPDAAPTDRVIGLSPLQVQRRFTAAARAAGIEAHLTAHSGRVGLASELTARGASTTEVMLAGNWRTSRMVAHYSAGATAERGAVKKYL